MRYRTNLMPDEYICKSRFRFSWLPRGYLPIVFILLLLICAYGFFYISTYYLSKHIKMYPEASGRTATPSLPAGQIMQEREKYRERLAVIHAVQGNTASTAAIVEALVQTAPAGTVLTRLEVNLSGEAGLNQNGSGTVTIEGELPSVELVGLYLSDLQVLPLIEGALAKEISYTGDRAIFTINAGAKNGQ